MFIVLFLYLIAITEVISDTELILKDEVENVENAEYHTQPKLDHSTLFRDVYESLNQNKVVGIFPEGGSHDRTTISFKINI